MSQVLRIDATRAKQLIAEIGSDMQAAAQEQKHEDEAFHIENYVEWEKKCGALLKNFFLSLC